MLSKPAVTGDEIDITLRVGMLNLEAYLAEEAGARDMVTDKGFSVLLDAKAKRFQGGRTAHDAFSHLITIERLPSVASSVSGKEIKLADIWKFRNRRIAQEFRLWFSCIHVD